MTNTPKIKLIVEACWNVGIACVRWLQKYEMSLVHLVNELLLLCGMQLSMRCKLQILDETRKLTHERFCKDKQPWSLNVSLIMSDCVILSILEWHGWGALVPETAYKCFRACHAGTTFRNRVFFLLGSRKRLGRLKKTHKLAYACNMAATRASFSSVKKEIL